MSTHRFSLEPVAETDFEAMVALRVEALRESLERLGRFDPQRARERLRAGFRPEHMRHIVYDDERVGFVTLRPERHGGTPALRLDHLYVLPEYQSRGIGAWVMAWIKHEARELGQDVTLAALKGSDANRFYLRHGFTVVREDEFDIEYRWSVRA